MSRTKKIQTVEERKKANINYCKKYRQKIRKPIEKPTENVRNWLPKELAPNWPQKLAPNWPQKNTNINCLKIELVLNVIEKGKEAKHNAT